MISISMQILYFCLPIHKYLKVTLFHLRHIVVFRDIKERRLHVVIIFIIMNILCKFIETLKKGSKESKIRENVEEVVGIAGEKLIEVTVTRSRTTSVEISFVSCGPH